MIKCRSTGTFISCIPGHVSAAGYDLIVVQKSATTEVAGVARQFPAHADVAFAGF